MEIRCCEQGAGAQHLSRIEPRRSTEESGSGEIELSKKRHREIVISSNLANIKLEHVNPFWLVVDDPQGRWVYEGDPLLTSTSWLVVIGRLLQK